MLAKLCRKTNSVLRGAQTILSITVKFHARRMRGAKSVQTIVFLNILQLKTPRLPHKISPYNSPLPQKRVALNSRACSLVPLTGVIPLLKEKLLCVWKGNSLRLASSPPPCRREAGWHMPFHKCVAAPQPPRLYVILSERLAARRSFGSVAKRNGQNPCIAPGSTKESL